MTFLQRDTPKGVLSLLDEGSLATPGDFLDTLMSAPSPTLVIESSSLPARFFDLKTGFAGEVLQKVSTYRRRLVVIGDFSSVTSKSLNDFIRESNSTGQVVFARDVDQAIGLLR